MAKDAELDRLKAAQDAAFQRKQNAYQAQQQSWNHRSNAREALNRAYEDKQRAYDAQESSWQDYQRLRSYNGPRIDQLNEQQDTAFKNMQRAFDNASSAHDRRDGASARSYADEGHRCKAESQGYVSERRRLVEELKSAKLRHDPYGRAFQQAKTEFDSAKHRFAQAKADHEQKEAEFKRAKADFDRAAKAFQSRLDALKSESRRKKAEKRSIAERAGVPYQYCDNVWISTDTEGNSNIYFGGAGEPNGPGHGHYVMDRSGTVTYKRDPYDPHGADNFESESAYIARQKAHGHIGGFGLPSLGYIDDHPVTFSCGWGTKSGETMIADGHLSIMEFRQSRNHDHYGPGDGPHANGSLRGAYTGPGA